MSVSVEAGIGSAPCDWVHGYVDPYTRRYLRFSRELQTIKPQVVVLMFTGNPGLSGVLAGCVDSNGPYTEGQLLSSYRAGLRTMAGEATAMHAAVIFERPPPRNPSVPVGYVPSKRSNAGFQGSPAVASLLQLLVRTAPHGARWIYAAGGAVLVSGPRFTYETRLPCDPVLEGSCTSGEVRVRDGGNDAVHLDPAGCGAALFAAGIDEGFTGESASQPHLTSDRQRYHACL